MINDKLSSLISIICVIGVLLLLSQCFGNESSNTYVPNDWRCWYCSKVIRSNGRNIHCTVIQEDEHSMYVICDYCGKKDVIKSSKSK